MKKTRGPVVPPERKGTVRQEIIALLEGNSPVTAKDISAEVRIPEKRYIAISNIYRNLSIRTGGISG